MTKSVTTETAALADAVNRAARVAPSKGAAYDKAAGIQIEVRPNHARQLRVLATDLESTFFSCVQVTDVGDEDATWRLPSILLSGFLSNLPLSAGKTVTFTDDGGVVTVKSGRSRAKLKPIPDALPKFKLFNPDGMARVPNFAHRVNQVAWAVDSRGNPPMSGVHIDGKYLIATDRFRCVIMPCVVPVDVPVTAPMSRLAGILRTVGDVSLRATDTRLEIMPDADTQLTCGLYALPFPSMLNILSIDTPYHVLIDKEPFVDALNRMLVLVKGERYPKMLVTVTSEHISFSMELDEVGAMFDEVMHHGGAVPPAGDIEFWAAPQNFLDGVMNATKDTVKLSLTGNGRQPFHFSDESDYSAWITPVMA